MLGGSTINEFWKQDNPGVPAQYLHTMIFFIQQHHQQLSNSGGHAASHVTKAWQTAGGFPNI